MGNGVPLSAKRTNVELFVSYYLVRFIAEPSKR